MDNARRFRRWVWVMTFLVAMWLPGVARAEAPTVSDNSATLVAGTESCIFMFSSASWTDSVWYLTYTILTPPQHGTVTQPYPNNACFVYYRANLPAGYAGTDTFTWCASIGNETSGVATCTVTITPNSVPVANPFSVSALSGVLAKPLADLSTYTTHAASDSGQTMTYMVVSQASHGTAYIDPVNATCVDYVSAPKFIGTDTFTWAVSDGCSISAPATATVTVLPGPPVPTSQTVIVAKNTPQVIRPSFIGGGYTFSVTGVAGPSQGTLAVTNGGTSFCYNPPNGYVGNDSFTWTMTYNVTGVTATATCSIVVKDVTSNADWTQWRFDECRSAQTPMVLPNPLYLQWRRDLPTCDSSFGGSWPDIDNCRPVQLGKTLFVSLMANDSVSAYDTDTGAQKWRYYAGGALRRPPVAMALSNGTNVVMFGCDDGYLYCLNAADGAELWKFQAAPNVKKVMGFGRLGSVWPIWASPVAYGGKVYFAAGYLPSWCLYVYCLDAATGEVVWRNDGRMVDVGHNSGFGPLAFSHDHGAIFGTIEGRTAPWVISAATGEFAGYTCDVLGANGTSQWFIDGNGGRPQASEPMSITAGDQTFSSADAGVLGVTGKQPASVTAAMSATIVRMTFMQIPPLASARVL